ncbi:hypothetical protein [Angustibacter aerolatus]
MKRPGALVPFVTTAVLAAGLTAVTAQSAQAAPLPQPRACPSVLPTASAVDGLTGTGWTVERGTTPEPFSATVLGRITDGIAPGVDMIMAELSSPALTRSGGVWEGMSGSPVYTADGHLIGSVSYGLAGSSPIAGITPAASLETLRTADPDGTRQAKLVRTTPQAARALRATGEATAAQATRFRQLPLPLTVSGVSGPGAARASERLAAVTGQQVRVAGGATRAAAPVPLEGGGNIAAAVAYGTVTLAAIGTTTYTCHGSGVAFGHPFLDAGVSTYSAHSASAVFVQPDPTRSPFKVANVGGVVGTVDRDRTLGIRIREGAAPVGTRLTSSVTKAQTGKVTTGLTTVVAPDFLSTATAYQAMSALDTAMGSGASKGGADLSLTITGTRAEGKAFRVTTGERFDSAGIKDLPLDLQAAMWADQTVSSITDQESERVKITGVSVTGTVTSVHKLWLNPTSQFRQALKWGSYGKGLHNRAGKPVYSRVTVTRNGDPDAKVTHVLPLTLPKAQRGHRLTLRIDGAGGEAAPEGFGDLDDLFDSLDPSSDTSATPTLTQVLAALASTPRSDEVVATLTDERGRLVSLRRWRATAPVTPFTTVRAVHAG